MATRVATAIAMPSLPGICRASPNGARETPFGFVCPRSTAAGGRAGGRRKRPCGRRAGRARRSGHPRDWRRSGPILGVRMPPCSGQFPAGNRLPRAPRICEISLSRLGPDTNCGHKGTSGMTRYRAPCSAFAVSGGRFRYRNPQDVMLPQPRTKKATAGSAFQLLDTCSCEQTNRQCQDVRQTDARR